MDILRTCFRHKQNNYYYAVFPVNKIPLSKKVMFILIVIVYSKKCPLILLLQKSKKTLGLNYFYTKKNASEAIKIHFTKYKMTSTHLDQRRLWL